MIPIGDNSNPILKGVYGSDPHRAIELTEMAKLVTKVKSLKAEDIAIHESERVRTQPRRWAEAAFNWSWSAPQSKLEERVQAFEDSVKTVESLYKTLQSLDEHYSQLEKDASSASTLQNALDKVEAMVCCDEGMLLAKEAVFQRASEALALYGKHEEVIDVQSTLNIIKRRHGEDLRQFRKIKAKCVIEDLVARKLDDLRLHRSPKPELDEVLEQSEQQLSVQRELFFMAAAKLSDKIGSAAYDEIYDKVNGYSDDSEHIQALKDQSSVLKRIIKEQKVPGENVELGQVGQTYFRVLHQQLKAKRRKLQNRDIQEIESGDASPLENKVLVSSPTQNSQKSWFKTGLEKLTSPSGAADSDYKWEKHEWGKLLIKSDKERGFLAKKFQLSVNRQKDALRAKRRHLDKALESQRKLQEESRSKGASHLDTEKEKELNAEIRELRSQWVDMEIDRRATIIQRLINLTGEKELALENKHRAMRTLKIYLDLPRGPSNEPSPAEQIESLAEETNQLVREIDILNDGYQAQMHKYRQLNRPTRPLREQIKVEAAVQVKEVLSLGYISAQYTPPQDFEVRMQYARLGYHWTEGLKSFADLDSNDVKKSMAGLVQEFLTWADNHPKAAETLLADVAITVQLFGGDTALNTLLSGIRTRRLTRAVLGQMGRAMRAEPLITRADFKWQALADLVRWAPTVTATTEVFGAAARGWNEGGALKAVTNGIATGITKGTQAKLIQQVTHAIHEDYLPLAEDIARTWQRPADPLASTSGTINTSSLGAQLSEINGDESNLNLSMIRGGRKVMQFWKDPKAVTKQYRRRISNQWAAVKKAKGMERFLRFASQFALPVLGVGVAGAGLAIVALGATAAPGLLLIGAGVYMTAYLPPMISTLLNSSLAYGATWKEIRRAEAEKAIEKSKQQLESLEKQRNSYLDKLRSKAFFLSCQAPVDGAILEEPHWLDAKAKIAKDFRQRLSTLIAVQDEQQALNAPELIRLFLQESRDKRLEEETKNAIGTLPNLALYNEATIQELGTYLRIQVLEEAASDYLSGELDRVLKRQLTEIIISNPSPEAFEEAEKIAAEQVKERKKDHRNILEKTQEIQRSAQESREKALNQASSRVENIDLAHLKTNL